MRLLLTERADHAVDLISICVYIILRQANGKALRFPQVDCVVKIQKGMAEITARNYSKRLSEERFTLTLQTDTSMYIPKSCVQHAEQSYIS